MMKRIRLILFVLVCGLALGAPFGVMAQSGFTIERVSVATDGTQGDGNCREGALSVDGRFVAFSCTSSNLVANDTNDIQDIFVRDRNTDTTARVSVASDGTQGNAQSAWPDISADGRYVVFGSDANNLVANDTNAETDIFLHDRNTGTTTRISVTAAGDQVDSASLMPSISGDGNLVAFESWSTEFVSGDTNSRQDIYVRDIAAATVVRASVASDGTGSDGNNQDPEIALDGNHVVFYAGSRNLVPNDTNNAVDVFVHDLISGDTERVSVATGGAQSNVDENSFQSGISGDGRFVAFDSAASNFVPDDTNAVSDVFLHDRQTGVTTRISVISAGVQGNGSSVSPSISADGRYIAFFSQASNLVPGDSNGFGDAFVYERLTGRIERVSVAANGAQGNEESIPVAISSDGHFVLISSLASNLVPNDTNERIDLFVVSGYFADPPNTAPRRHYFTTATPELTWNRISWATTYRLEIDDAPTFAAPLVYEHTTTTPDELSHIVATPLADGLYYWRVRAIIGGTSGAWSATESFVVNAP